MAGAVRSFIGLEWVDAQDAVRFDVFDPATGEVIVTAPDPKQADVDGAVSGPAMAVIPFSSVDDVLSMAKDDDHGPARPSGRRG